MNTNYFLSSTKAEKRVNNFNESHLQLIERPSEEVQSNIEIAIAVPSRFPLLRRNRLLIYTVRPECLLSLSSPNKAGRGR